MSYTKPEVSILGAASAVVEFVPNKLGSGTDCPPPYCNPAYDLDE